MYTYQFFIMKVIIIDCQHVVIKNFKTFKIDTSLKKISYTHSKQAYEKVVHIMLPGRCKLKQLDTTIYPVEQPKLRILITSNAKKMQNRNPHSSLLKKQNGITTLEDRWAVSHKIKHILIRPSNNYTPWYSIYPNELKFYTYTKICTRLFIQQLNS